MAGYDSRPMAQPPTSEAEKVAALRDLLPATGAGIYLDTATAGPLPAETAAAVREAEEWELRVGRAAAGREEDVEQRASEVQAVVAALIGAEPADVVPAAGVGQALALGLHGLDWRAGDRLLASPSNDPLLLEAARRACRPLGVEVVVDALDGALPDATRVVLLPAVAPASGRLMPILEIAARLRANGVRLAVDASFAAGAMPFSVSELGAELAVLACDRWALGPEATAALWRSGGRSKASVASMGLARTAMIGLARSIGWLEMYVGLEWAFERTGRLARGLADELEASEGVELLTRTEAMAGIVTFRLPASWSAAEAADELGRRVFAIVRPLPTLNAIRASVAWFNTEEELGRFAEAVAELARHTPETLPRRPSLTIL